MPIKENLEPYHTRIKQRQGPYFTLCIAKEFLQSLKEIDATS